MRSFIIVTLLLCTFTASVPATAATPNLTRYLKLADRRAEIAFPTLTDDEKAIILDQAHLLMADLYVHRERKLKLYGAGVDALPMLDALAKDASTVNAETFHRRASHAFTAQRDLHTNYLFPKPYSCYATLLPFDFTLVRTGSGDAIAVSRLLGSDDVLKLAPAAAQVQVGDILISFNGKAPFEAAKDFYEAGGGSNRFARLRYAVGNMTYFSHVIDFVPNEDTVRLELQHSDGKTYAVELPWISRLGNAACVSPPPAEFRKTVEKPNPWVGSDLRQLEKDEVYRQEKKSRANFRAALADVWTPTADPILRYRIVDNAAGRFGIIRMDSFVPGKLSVDEYIDEVRRILLDPLASVDGIIFDVRSNGGGYLPISDKLVQLFVPSEILSSRARFRNSPANAFFIENATTGRFDETYRDALKQATDHGQRLTGLVRFYDDALVNRIGQSFFKPVAIFTNANCYSACDTFSAQMQDQGRALVIGEDAATGGGGANVWKMSEFFSSLPEKNKGSFKSLPQSMDMRVAWRQTVRTGKNAGKLIEDAGITPERLAPASVEDLTTNASHQILSIGRALRMRDRNYQGSIRLASTKTLDILEGSPLITDASIQGTDRVAYYDGDQLIGVQRLNRAGNHQLQIPSFVSGRAGQMGRFKVLGLSGSRRVWRQFIDYRSVPPFTSFSSGKFTANFNSTSEASGMTMYTSDGKKGWNVSQGRLLVGDGKEYENDLVTRASVFLDLAGRPTLNLRYSAEVHTEEAYDFLDIVVIADGKAELVGQHLSGDIPETGYAIDLGRFVGKKVEIQVSFIADGGVVASGPSVSSFELE